MSNFRRAGGAPQVNSILRTLQATEMIASRPVLPAEILAAILDYLPIPDLMNFARTSRRMREMVYDDTRWVARLKSMGCWDETEARRRFEDTMRRRREAAEKEKGAAAAAAATAGGAGGTGPPSQQYLAGQRPQVTSTTLFDATIEEERQARHIADLRDGFEATKVTAGAPPPARPASDPFEDPEALLQVIRDAKSVRGYARQEYGKIYGALAPFYFDLARAKSHTDPVVFKVFKDPERQARMLANLRTFAGSDWAPGWRQREEKLAAMTAIFEKAVLREFEQGYEFWDVDGRMRRYAHVLDVLNGGTNGVDLFIQKHPIFTDKEVLLNSVDCINLAPADDVTLEPSRHFFEVLSRKVDEQAAVIERIFPRPGEVFWAFVDKVREDIIMEYATPLFDETHERSILSYLKAVSGLFEQVLQFYRALTPPPGAKENQLEKAKELALKTFEPHLDLYLQEELDYFTKEAEDQVVEWEKKLSAQDASAESFYMGNFNRQADKKDFLTSFKKVIMMPVSVLPTSLSLPLPLPGPFGGSGAKTPVPNGAATASAPNENVAAATGATPQPSRPQTPGLPSSTTAADQPGGTPKQPEKVQTDELAAKAALMTSRLEGIKSLFSIEVALSLVHSAKSSLGRASVFIQLGGQAGGEAKEQCEMIFVVLLRILGTRHVKSGFEKAVDHLSQYNPREVSNHDDKGGVAPLVTFIELVNVGDLISQMVDVFYEQQLAQPKIADRNDFLDPAGMAKKKFEQMLDESVAAGLNKGIDVLMDEVEYICATTQLPTDYNPEAAEVDGEGGGVAAGGGAGANGSSNNRNSKILSFPPVLNLTGSGFGPGAGTTKPPSSGGAAPGPGGGAIDIGPTPTALRVTELVASHTQMLVGSTEKTMLDVFNGEVGLRLFAAVCKHLKRQRVSTGGAVRLIADMACYFEWIRTLRNPDLLPYFRALRELAQIYLIDARHARDMAAVIADGDRFAGVFRAEEVYEYAERRADWYQVRRDVERAMYGLECAVM